MDQGLLPRRYAKALYKFAVEKGDQKAVYGYMQKIGEAFDANPGLQSTLANPFVEATTKAALVRSAAGLPADTGTAKSNDAATDTKATKAQSADSSADTLNDFVKLLVENRRIDILHEIALAYMLLYRKLNNIYAVTITSASPLDDADRKRLCDLVQKHLGSATAQYTFNVDPDIIGGFVVSIENERLDASVKNELEQLRLILKK